MARCRVAVYAVSVGLALAGFGLAHGEPVDRPDLERMTPQDPASFTRHGGVGLIETRSARFLPDGEVAAGASYAEPLASYYLSWQAAPWLELTARYGEGRGMPGDIDRALDLKFRLVEEGDFLPAIALGFQDALGSGNMSGEYLVFSKRRGAFDISFGLGWGHPGARDRTGNPFGWLSGSFKRRSANPDRSGVPAVGNYFSGRIGMFGGIEYM
ncbi:MAG: YjbH domain-containing protein, partial [Sphingomonadales bacterium]